MIELLFEDILHADVDAIVNPANRFMLHGGGLAAAIMGAAGPEVRAASESLAPIQTGEAIVTGAGRLPFKGIIHTVGPFFGEDGRAYRQNVHNDWGEDVDKLLELAHLSCLERAAEKGWKSLAFPAISCGVFRFPVERAAPIAVEALRAAEDYGVERVLICVLDDSHFDAYSQALGVES